MLSLPHALSMGLEITGMALLSRVYVPFDSTGNKAFGMGAAEKSAYDPMNKAALIDAPVQSRLHDAPLHLFTPSLIAATYLLARSLTPSASKPC